MVIELILIRFSRVNTKKASKLIKWDANVAKSRLLSLETWRKVMNWIYEQNIGSWLKLSHENFAVMFIITFWHAPRSLTNFQIIVDVVVDVRCSWNVNVGGVVGLLWRCKRGRQVSCKKWVQEVNKNKHKLIKVMFFSPAACCCCAGGWRCKNGWLKKASNGIRSFALRRNKPKRRSWSSGVVPTGTLKEQNRQTRRTDETFNLRLT